MAKIKKEYYIDADGKLQVVKEEEYSVIPLKENPVLEPVKEEVTDKNEIVYDMHMYNQMARTNPFLYNYDMLDPLSLQSIEEFYLTNGKKEVLFEELIRTNKFRKAKRKRILKRNFKKWNNEVKKEIEMVSSFKDIQYDTSKGIQLDKINILYFLMPIITLLYSFVLLNAVISIFPYIDGVFRKGIYFCVLASIFSFACANLINSTIDYSRKKFKYNQKFYYKELLKLEKDYKKNFRNTYKYYVSGLTRNALNFKKKKLVIDKTSIKQERIKAIQYIANNGSVQMVKNNKLLKPLKFFKFVVCSLSNLSLLYLIGISIYNLVLYFIDKF